jgi:hypothetical protein
MFPITHIQSFNCLSHEIWYCSIELSLMGGSLENVIMEYSLILELLDICCHHQAMIEEGHNLLNCEVTSPRFPLTSLRIVLQSMFLCNTFHYCSIAMGKDHEFPTIWNFQVYSKQRMVLTLSSWSLLWLEDSKSILTLPKSVHSSHLICSTDSITHRLNDYDSNKTYMS